MTKDDAEYVSCTINNEGFHYAFVHYSSYSQIKDEKFHELRKNYLKSIEEMKNYIVEAMNG